MEVGVKRIIEDDDPLSVLKKIKTEFQNDEPLKQEVTKVNSALDNVDSLLNGVKQEFTHAVDLGDSDAGDPFNGTDNTSSMNNSEELSDGDSEDVDGIDSDTDESGEERTLDELDGSGDPEENGYYMDGEDMGVETILEEGTEITGELPLNSELQCNNCYKVFARKSYLRGHSCSKDLEINNKALKCKFCNKRYSHRINLRLHLKLHLNPKQFQCHLCLKYLSSSSSLKVHVKTHTSEKAFKCDHCPLAFNQKVHLTDHVLSHHTTMRPYNCHMCNKTYVSKSVLKKHLKKHLGLYKYSCEVCGKLFFDRSALKKHMRTHTSNFPLNKLKSDEPLQCHTCLTYFHFKYKMIAHQMLDHGLCREKDNCYQCPLCDIQFNVVFDAEAVKEEAKTEESEPQQEDEENTVTDGNSVHIQVARNTNNLLEPEYPTHLNDHKSIFAKLKITPDNLNMIISEHIKSHEYVENHMCELCFKVFETRDNLLRHLKIHDDKERKRFKCEQCDKRFMVNVDLVKHTNAVHEKLRLHECDICGRNFSQRNNLKRHLEEVHRTDGLKFECYVCSKVLATGHSLKRHLLIHNGPKYTCDICQREFTRVYELNVHKKLHEDENVPNQLRCQYCGKTFVKRSNLKAHVENNHLDYTCLECQEVGQTIKFDTKKSLLLHLKTQHKNLISNVYLTCTICYRTFLNDHDLGRHMKMHEDDNQIQCQFCHRYFSRHYNLKMHLKTCTKNKSNGILTCSDEENSLDEYPQHNENYEDVDMQDMLVPEIKMEYKVNDNYELEEAEYEEKTLEPMQHFTDSDMQPIIHVELEKRDPLSVEDIINAGEVSITPIPIQRPSRSQSNNPQKITQCHICLKTFVKRDSLKKHMKVFHTYIPEILLNPESGEVKPILETILQNPSTASSKEVCIICKICKKTFTRKDSLRKHMRRFHIVGDQNIKKEFTEGEINRNMLDVILKESGHEIKSRIPCDLCYKTFTRKDSLRKHMKIFHIRPSDPLKAQPENEQDPLSNVQIKVENQTNTTLPRRTTAIANVPHDRIPCSLCDKTFTRKDSLKKHTRIFHSQNLDSQESTSIKKEKPVGVPFIDHIRCELCDKSFTRKDSLTKHNRNFHGGGDPKIMDDQMATESINFLEVVLDENRQGPVSTTNEILCRICNKTFTRNYNLKKHMKTVHKIEDNGAYFGYVSDETDAVEQFGSLSNSMLEVIMDEEENEQEENEENENPEDQDSEHSENGNEHQEENDSVDSDNDNLEIDSENEEAVENQDDDSLGESPADINQDSNESQEEIDEDSMSLEES